MTCHDAYDDSATVAPTLPRPLYVVGIDDSHGSATALRWAVDKAVATGGEVYAVHVFHARTVLPAARSPYVPADVSAANEEQQVALVQARNIVESALAGVPEAESARIEVAAVPGDPQPTLIALSTGSDALVLGASHHAGLAARVLGSTALGCAANALCPVMIVPASWVRSDSRAPAASETGSSTQGRHDALETAGQHRDLYRNSALVADPGRAAVANRVDVLR